MYEYGQIVKIKKNLLVGRRYGGLVYTEHHAKLKGKLLSVYKVSSSGTYYLAEGETRYTTTFDPEMLETPKFKIGDKVRIVNPHKNTIPIMSSLMMEHVGQVGEVRKMFLRCNSFTYVMDIDVCNMYPEEALSYISTDQVDDLFSTLDNEIYGDKNQLQREATSVVRGERIQGSGVHGRICKATIQSRSLRDSKAIRGR